MNHYQQGFLAGLTNKAAETNPLLTMYNEFLAGEEAKKQNMKFNVETWAELSLTFREGFKSLEFVHLASKGSILKIGYNNWVEGHVSGLNKYNNVLSTEQHSIPFTVSVPLTAKNNEAIAPFVQHYTFLDHRNEVYRIEARHRLGLTSVYPSEHIINKSPCMPGNVSTTDLMDELNSEVVIGVHDILQSSITGYRPLKINGINFLTKAFQEYTKLLIDIPQWNVEANKLVDWELNMPDFN